MKDSDEQLAFTATLPPELSKARLTSDLDKLLAGQYKIVIKEISTEKETDRLGQIDPTTVEIVLTLLDTKAAAAAVQTTLGAVIGYIFAKTGKKPDQKD